MNVNGSKFKALIGEADWLSCRVGEPAIALGDWHRTPLSSPPGGSGPAAPFAYDPRRGQIGLGALPVVLPPTVGEARLIPEMRRAAAADRFGNVYGVDASRAALLVWRSSPASRFWPPDASPGNPVTGDFAPDAVEPDQPAQFQTLSVTEDHYLIVAFRQGTRSGVMVFDLAAGGPPALYPWPQGVSINAFAMAARTGGGAWILDRDAGRVWELGRHLRLMGPRALAGAQEMVDAFQPEGAWPVSPPTMEPPRGIDLAALVGGPVDATALCQWRAGLLVLDRGTGVGPSRVLTLARDGGDWTLVNVVPFDTAIHDMILAGAIQSDPAGAVDQLLAAPTTGNQLQAFAVTEVAPGKTEMAIQPVLLPCRLYGGRALVSVKGIAHYDTGPDPQRWVPAVQQPQSRFPAEQSLSSPVFDSAEHGCTWDRVLFDGCVPAGTAIVIEARASDATDQIDAAVWQGQPLPYRRAIGPELPWYTAPVARLSRDGRGDGTFEVLLQRVRGRYGQLRLTLRSEGTQTPRISALRVWHPRFSYATRFLPGVYREDPASGDFVERLLANFEGINTTLECRIVNSQALFDPRTAPSAALDWLAAWFDVALDPGWDDHRRRMFIAHAMDFFAWRGTVHGLRLALMLAFEPCFDPSAFAGPWAMGDRPQAIRIVEAFMTRRMGSRVTGDPVPLGGPLNAAPQQGLWSPAERNAGLCQRYAASMGVPASAGDLMQGLSFVPPAGLEQQWQDFAAANLGFVPKVGPAQARRWNRFQHILGAEFPVDLPSDWSATDAGAWRGFCQADRGSAEVLDWQAFLARRYRSIARLNSAHGTGWPAFDLIAFPDRLPQTAAAQTDWLDAERLMLPMRQSAHRFSVLLPVTAVDADPSEAQRRLAMAQRIIALEKPAHTVFDVRYYWALNRVGEARLGLDTVLGQGSRAPELIPAAILGRAYAGASFVGGRTLPDGPPRMELAC